MNPRDVEPLPNPFAIPPEDKIFTFKDEEK